MWYDNELGSPMELLCIVMCCYILFAILTVPIIYIHGSNI